MSFNKENYYQRGEGEWAGIITLALIGFAIFGIIVFGKSLWGGEKEGYVKYSDCREIITIKPNFFDKLGKQFTCDYRKTQSGKIIDGECVSVKNQNGMCVQASVYEVKPPNGCTDPKYPYLGFNDKCYAVPQ